MACGIYGSSSPRGSKSGLDLSCPICGKNFTTKCGLVYHIERHTGQGKYKCSFCEKTFNMKNHLDGHENSHTNSRPYICGKCNKGFAYKNKKVHHEKLCKGFVPSKHSMHTPPEQLQQIQGKGQFSFSSGKKQTSEGTSPKLTPAFSRATPAIKPDPDLPNPMFVTQGPNLLAGNRMTPVTMHHTNSYSDVIEVNEGNNLRGQDTSDACILIAPGQTPQNQREIDIANSTTSGPAANSRGTTSANITSSTYIESIDYTESPLIWEYIYANVSFAVRNLAYLWIFK